MQTQIKRYWNKYTRLGVIVILALSVAIATSEINNTYLESKVKLVKIVVAAENIKPYTELKRENLTYREVVKAEVPADALDNLEIFLQEGPMFAGEVGFIKGYPIKKSLTNNSLDSVFGSPLGLKEGKSYLGIAIDQVRAQLVKPGIMVDAYCFFQSSALGGNAQIISKLEDPLLGGLYVHAVKDKDNEEINEKNRGAIPAVVVVETVSPEQTGKLIYYQTVGKIFLVPIGTDSQKYLRKEAR